ncbi:TPA: trypsin-like peptidase domain-containing protein [Aeromonas hydrophila]|nr:trypsin-like peptidase domain-containing protein [Aeromonas hydrophila]
MALIPPFYLDCVVSIGIQSTSFIQGALTTQMHWIGTGFLVGRLVEGTEPQQYNTYLVTNKHVIQNQQLIFIKFNSLLGNLTTDLSYPLYNGNNQNWVGHPDPNIDVAVMPIDPHFLNGENARFSFFELDKHGATSITLRNLGASEGDFLYVLGFPMGIVTNQNNCVIARSGIIARIRDVLAGASSAFLIDANIYPGNSGGPVINKPETTSIAGTNALLNASLIGMVKSYVPYRDVAVSQQTGNPRVTFEENSGLALVETVDSIIATVDLAYYRFTNPPMLNG